jgi:hypothetical protein
MWILACAGVTLGFIEDYVYFSGWNSDQFAINSDFVFVRVGFSAKITRYDTVNRDLAGDD